MSRERWTEDDEIDDLEADLAESLRDPAFRASYEDAKARAGLIRDLAKRRQGSELTQQIVAERMGTTQSAVSEFEGGASDPRLSTLQRYARAIGSQIAVGVVPAGIAAIAQECVIAPWLTPGERSGYTPDIHAGIANIVFKTLPPYSFVDMHEEHFTHYTSPSSPMQIDDERIAS